MSNRQINIEPTFDNVSDIGSVTSAFLDFYAEGYHHVDTLLVHNRYLANLMKFFEEHQAKILIGRKQKKYIALDYDGHKVICFTWKHSFTTNKFNLTIITNGSAETLIKFTGELPLDCVEDGGVELTCYYASSKYGLTDHDLYVDPLEFGPIYNDLYPDVNVAELVKQYNAANEPVLMLYGEPGVGKTTFIKYIIANGGYKKAAYIKDPKVMEDGEMWSKLTDSSYDLIIFDDLDVGLLPRRKNENSVFMTQLLSFSDGLFTQGKIKIIITTNQAIKEIDSALVRPGRCFDFIKLNPLDRADAVLFWTEVLKLDVDLFEKTFGKADIITQASLMSEAKRRELSGARSYIKRGSNSYTLDDKLKALGIQTSDGESRKASF